MLTHRSNIFCLADEDHIEIKALSGGMQADLLVRLPVDALTSDDPTTVALPASIRRTENHLLVVPDYWIGNRLDDFNGRSRKLAAAFVERKLKQDHPGLAQVDDFYHLEMVAGQDQRPQLYSCYLQETVAYRLHAGLQTLGIGPRRITSPAMIWQDRLAASVDDFNAKGIGFVHLTATEGFLYFYAMGQFLFSRHIPLVDGDDPESGIYDLLNYEINQSFYLYSQKARHSVAALYLLATDPAAVEQLSTRLGQDVRALPGADRCPAAGRTTPAFPACCAFSVDDLTGKQRSAISYKPLAREMAWRPVQWTGVFVGALLLLLLGVEAGWLWHWSGQLNRQRDALRAESVQAPVEVLEETGLLLDEITGDLSRPSGGELLMKAFLAVPAGVAIQQFTLGDGETPRLTIQALVQAADPDAFQKTLQIFLNRLNQGYQLRGRPLRENDVRISRLPDSGPKNTTAYQITVDFEVT